MRIFNGFLVMLVACFLFMLPLTLLIYDYRTDVEEDSFTVATGIGVTTTDVVLTEELYDDDIDSIEFDSSISETPATSSYTSLTRTLAVASLTANTTRLLTVSYDKSAFDQSGAIGTLVDRIPFIWLAMVIALPPAAIVAIFLGRGD